MRKKFVVFVSGYGRGAIEIIKDFENSLIYPELSLILSSFENSYSLKIAEENGISTAIVKRDIFKSKNEFEEEILKILKFNNIDYIFLAGWNYIVGEKLLNSYKNKIVNIHPSILPSFKGKNAIDQAIEAGVKITGITTHFVDSSIDGGKIIEQKCIRINEGDNFRLLDNKIFKSGTVLTLETINTVFI
ncbi:MAG: formyltransferase family protein [Bacteroidota bacterium]|nr:formyltransferase family protein [Bacteroidota bacterium]